MAPVAKAVMEKIGMKVDMQSMDWQTLVSRRAKKDPPDKGGWNALITSTGAVDSLDPLTYNFISASCDKAWFGWPCDAEITRLRQAFADEPDEAKRKEIVEKLQLRAAENPTHAFLGQSTSASAMRTNITRPRPRSRRLPGRRAGGSRRPAGCNAVGPAPRMPRTPTCRSCPPRRGRRRCRCLSPPRRGKANRPM